MYWLESKIANLSFKSFSDSNLMISTIVITSFPLFQLSPFWHDKGWALGRFKYPLISLYLGNCPKWGAPVMPVITFDLKKTRAWWFCHSSLRSIYNLRAIWLKSCLMQKFTPTGPLQVVFRCCTVCLDHRPHLVGCQAYCKCQASLHACQKRFG